MAEPGLSELDIPPELMDVYRRNAPYVRQPPYLKPGIGQYNTPLNPIDELSFRDWVSKNNVPFDPEAKVSDYDMRGFWRASQNGSQFARSGVDPNDQKIHYSDVWKTPFHNSFSGVGGPYTAGSKWATPVAPQWNAQDQLLSPGGRVLVDERMKRPNDPLVAMLKGWNP